MANPVSFPAYQGDYAADATVYLYWNTFGASDESITLTGLTTSDIKIYKNGSATSRSSDAGYTLLDTDGIDIDGATGCHGISIDLSDDTDSGFYTIGNEYMVMVNSVTVNAQTVRFCVATFSIENRSGVQGVGDYAVTLTIRKLAGAAIAGLSVWVNNTNTRSGAVAGTKVTDTNGEVVFNLEYTTFYIFCNLATYTFTSASFTAASGSVTFTKDIGTAVNSGSSSSYDDSFLTRALASLRENLDEPTIKAKYDDPRCIVHLEEAYMIVLSDLNRNSKTQIVARLDITVADGVTEYVLPHTVGSVYAIYSGGEEGGKVFYDSRSRTNPFGRGLWIEGKTIHLQSPTQYGLGTVLTVEYIPSGIARLHNGTCTIDSDGDAITFGATPNVGSLDTHPKAYAGSVFRHLETDGSVVTGNQMQERTIISYNTTTRVADLDVVLDPIPTTDDGISYYEIAPAISKGMDTVLGLYAAYRICLVEGNRKRAEGILAAYRNTYRNVRLTEYYTHMGVAAQLRADNSRNRRYRRL